MLQYMLHHAGPGRIKTLLQMPQRQPEANPLTFPSTVVILFLYMTHCELLKRIWLQVFQLLVHTSLSNTAVLSSPAK